MLMCRMCHQLLHNTNDEYSCLSCGVTWKSVNGILTSPAPRTHRQSGESEDFFNRYHQERTTSSSLIQPWWARLETLDPTRLISELTKLTTPKVVMEIGCGNGSNLSTVLEAYPDVAQLIGCDVSFEALTYAQARIANESDAKNLLLIHSDGAHLPVELGCADLVLLINVLHHTTDLSLIGDAARFVRRGGIVLIIDLHSGNLLCNASRIAWKYLPKPLKRRFNSDLLVDDKAPDVQLVDLSDLDIHTAQSGLIQESAEFKGLFLFIFQYFCILFPVVADYIPKYIWLRLAMAERAALMHPFFQRRCAAFGLQFRKI